ncbi:MAG: radical SAM protein [Lachnospiraceae bacterium]|nr:radical SAM protein [Lachnospiraceae bacterium]
MNLSDCTLCPRECHVNRNAGQTGYCGQTSDIVAARAAIHMWEEPCISGTNGSGAVFFGGCNLHCVFCQNYAISQTTNMKADTGRVISISRLSEIYLELQEKGAHNINLVTPTHYIPQIIESLELAKKNGLRIPIVYNTGCYEKVETLKQLEGFVDIYLPDLKYFSPDISRRYSNAPDYFIYASAAIEEMFRQIGTPVFEASLSDGSESHKAAGNESLDTSNNTALDISETSLMKKGVIVRHLLLPDCAEDSRQVVHYLHQTYGNNIYMSIMNQYTPMLQVAAFPSLNRKVTEQEYDALIDYAISLGIENAFIQEGSTASESFIPAFTGEGI